MQNGISPVTVKTLYEIPANFEDKIVKRRKTDILIDKRKTDPDDPHIHPNPAWGDSVMSGAQVESENIILLPGTEIDIQETGK